jgi:hypothetical protein
VQAVEDVAALVVEVVGGVQWAGAALVAVVGEALVVEALVAGGSAVGVVGAVVLGAEVVGGSTWAEWGPVSAGACRAPPSR